MPDWIAQPHAVFVALAYALALGVFIGLLAQSLCRYRRIRKQWESLSRNDGS